MPAQNREEHALLGTCMPHTRRHWRCLGDCGKTAGWPDLVGCSQRVPAPARFFTSRLMPCLKSPGPPPLEPPCQLHEHICSSQALLTHVCVPRQACAPPMGGWQPSSGVQVVAGELQDNPLLRKPQAMPAGRDRGPDLTQEEGGVGGARARLGRAQEPVPVKQEPGRKRAS